MLPNSIQTFFTFDQCAKESGFQFSWLTKGTKNVVRHPENLAFWDLDIEKYCPEREASLLKEMFNLEIIELSMRK